MHNASHCFEATPTVFGEQTLSSGQVGLFAEDRGLEQCPILRTTPDAEWARRGPAEESGG